MVKDRGKHKSSMYDMHPEMGAIKHGKNKGKKGGVEDIGAGVMKKMTKHLGKAAMHHDKVAHHMDAARQLSGAMPPPASGGGGKVLKSRMYG